MDLQQIILSGLFLIFIVYMGFMYRLRRKKKNGLGKNGRRQKRTFEKVSKSVNDSKMETFNDFIPVTIDKKLYTEKGDRVHWYKITISFNSGDVKEYDFYSYSSDISREEILNQRFYVNNHEILIVDESGDHYINRNKIDQIDFLERKILANQSDSKELGDLFEEQVQEIEREEMSDIANSVIDSMNEEFKTFEQKEEIESAYSKRGRFFKIKKVKRPSVKKVEVKYFNRIFIVVMAFILLSGVFALVRTFGIGGRVNQVEAVQKKLSGKISTESVNIDETYPFQINSYLSEFISEYMFLSADQDQMKARKESLAKFYASNIPIDNDELSTSRKLISSELVDLSQKENYSTASYRVVYSVDIAFEKVKKEKSGDSFENVSYVEYENQEKTAVMNIDFIEKNGKVSIISPPYFSAINIENAGFEGVSKNEDTSNALKADQIKEIHSFLDIFFEKYASGTNEEIQYFMKNVESLGGGYTVDSVESVEAFTHEDYVTVYANVTFVEDDSNLKHKENFSLKLAKEEKQYKVNELKHNLGGF